MMSAPPSPTGQSGGDDGKDICPCCNKELTKHDFKQAQECQNFIDWTKEKESSTKKEKSGKEIPEKCPQCNFDMIQKFGNRIRCPNCNYENRYD